MSMPLALIALLSFVSDFRKSPPPEDFVGFGLAQKPTSRGEYFSIYYFNGPDCVQVSGCAVLQNGNVALTPVNAMDEGTLEVVNEFIGRYTVACIANGISPNMAVPQGQATWYINSNAAPVSKAGLLSFYVTERHLVQPNAAGGVEGDPQFEDWMALRTQISNAIDSYQGTFMAQCKAANADPDTDEAIALIRFFKDAFQRTCELRARVSRPVWSTEAVKVIEPSRTDDIPF